MIKIKIDIKIIIMIQKTQPVKIFPSYYRYMSSEMENHVSFLGYINSFHYIIIIYRWKERKMLVWCELWKLAGPNFLSIPAPHLIYNLFGSYNERGKETGFMYMMTFLVFMFIGKQ